MTAQILRLVIAGMVMYLVGVLVFLFPNESYFFLRRWAYQQPELSDEGIIAEKIGGVAGMLGGIMLITGIFLYF